MSFDDVYSYAFEAGKKAGKSERTAELWSYGLLFAAAAFFFWSSSDGLDQYKSFNKATEITAGHIVDQGPGDEDHDDWALYRFNVDGITYVQRQNGVRAYYPQSAKLLVVSASDSL